MSVSRERQQAPPDQKRQAPERRLGRPSRVVDADAARAQTTEALLASLADRLGLRADAIRVHVDGEAATRTRTRGARGVQADGAIWLDPDRYDPRRADGRALLAHEAVHAAQRAETRLRPDRRPPSLAEAEREAAAVADAVREGRAPRRPAATLPPGALAADTGAVAVRAVPPTQPRRATDPLELYRRWRAALDGLVAQVGTVYRRQLNDLTELVEGVVVSDGDVDAAMAILDAVPAEDAAAIVRALGPKRRVRLVDNVSDSHRRNFRRSVLASYAALTRGELAGFDEDLFDDLSLVQLDDKERFLAVLAFLDLPADARRELMTGKRRPEVEALMGTPVAAQTRLDELDRRVTELTERAAAEAAIESEQRTLVATLQELLRDPSWYDADRALELLEPLVPRTATSASPGEAAGGRAPVDEAAEEPRQEPPTLAVVLDRLEATGAIERLIDRVTGRRADMAERLRPTFLAVLRHRPVDANVRLAVSLLDTGIWDWRVSDAEARLAYDVVRALPVEARERFFRRDEGAWLHRLERNLPDDVLERADFAALSLVRNEDNQLVEAQPLDKAGKDVLNRILRIVDERRGAELAVLAFNAILAVEAPEVRRSIVTLLDTLDRLDRVLERLPDEILFSESRRLDLARVLAARDPRHLERHIRYLIGTRFTDWAVNSREAFLALAMLRALPVPDRERFGQLDFIVGELSASMRASAGLHMLDGRSAATQRDAVKERLRDERLWTAEHAAELRSLVQIIVALGDRAWVFAQSFERRAWTLPALRPMVARFHLYDPDAGRTVFVPDRVDEAGFWDDYGAFSTIKVIASALWIVVRDGFRGRIYVQPFAERIGHKGFALEDAQDMLGGDVAGVRFRDPDASPDDDERASEEARRGGGSREVATNEVAIHWDQRRGMLSVDLPALELDSIGRVGTNWSFHTGRVSARGITVRAEFQTDDFSHPRRAAVRVDDLLLDDVLFGRDGKLNAAASVHAGTLGIFGDVGDEPARPPSSTLLPVPIFAPIIELVRLLLDAKKMASGGAAEQLVPGALGLRGIQVSLGSFRVEGLSLGADQQIASLDVAGLRLAWGGTRTQYLRALITALQRRIGSTTDAAEQEKLREQQDAARLELRRLEPQEARLLELIRRSQTDPDSLTPADHAEILELQQSGRGGVVVDAGTITLRGLGGRVSAREVTVDRLRGQGTSEALTAGLLTDEARLQQFARQGPPTSTPEELRDRSEIELEAGAVTAVDVAIEAEIPATSRLERERTQLRDDRVRLERARQEELLRRVDARIARLDDLIVRRTELDELEALGSRASQSQLQQRRELHTELARCFGVTIARSELRGVRVGLDLETGRVGLTTAELEITGVESDTFAVARVTGTNVRGSVDLAPGLAGLRGVPDTIQAIDAARGPGFGADALHLEGVRAGALGSTVAAIDVTGLSGSAERIPDGWRISDLTIGSLSVSGIDYGTADRRIRSTRPLTFSGITARLKVTSTGEGDARQTTYVIERVDIAEISVSGSAPGAEPATGVTPTPPATEPALTYEDFVSGLRANVYSGSLRGVWVEGLTIRQSEAGTTFETPVDTPVAGVRQFDAFRFATAFGESFSIGGVLSSPAGAESDAFGVQFASDGSTVLDLLNLALGDGTLTTPNGTVRIDRLPGSGRVRIRTEGGVTEIGLEGFHIPELVLGRIDWQLDDGSTITALGRSTLVDIRTTLGIRKDETGVASAEVTTLTIDRITAEDLRYQKDPLDIHMDGHPPLDVRDVRIEGLHWDREHGVTSGTVSVAAADVGIDARFAADMRATGTIRARSISLRFEPEGRFTARGERVDIDADVTMGTTTASLAIAEMDTGGIEVSRDRIRIGAGLQPHLKIGKVHLRELHFEGAGVVVDVGTTGGRGIDLNDLDTALTIDLNPPGTTPRVRRLTIDTLDLAELTAADVTIDDPANGLLHITRFGSRAAVEGIRVRELAVEPDGSGSWRMAGFGELHFDLLRLNDVDVGVEIGEILRRRAAAAAAAGATTPSGFDPKSLWPFRELLNSLNGQIDIDLVLPIYLSVSGTRYRVDNVTQDAFWLRIFIDHGQVDLTEVEDTAFEGEFDSVIDFEVENEQLVLELDPRALLTVIGAVAGTAAGARWGPVAAALGAAIGGGAGFVGGSLARTVLVRWNLDPVDPAVRADELMILHNALDYTVLSDPAPVSLFSLSQFELPPSSGSSSVTVDAPNIQLNNINADLELVNEDPLPITLPGGLGTITLRPFGLSGLRILGNLPGSAPLAVGIDALDVGSLDLNIAGVGRLTSDRLFLEGLRQGKLTFTGFSPERFTGQLQLLRWSNVTLTGTAAPPLSPTGGAGTPPPGGTTP